ncbi:hypothetical protein PHLCEN_2v4471 [Hermanssonia centrifuga]|uniref:Uncharacterized protein n=1 Tax=Hermanssonia centrifuga TaxID=98765 RepID=A0A2R6PN80_9APHY|nr:hypothetical protein PHLCEN_2v4471 [Hermanssonia centrifuga]
MRPMRPTGLFSPPALWRKLSTRLKYFISLVIFVILLAVVFSEGLMAAASSSGDAWVTNLIDGMVQNQTGIALLGYVYNINIPTRQLQIEWLIIGCGDYRSANTVLYSHGRCGRLSREIDFYVDGTIDPTYAYNPRSNPHPPNSDIPTFVQAMQGFTTTHLLVLYAWKGLDQQYGYPFDGYQLDTTFTAIDHETNQSLPILVLRAIDATDNFFPTLRYDIATEAEDENGATILTRTMEFALARTGFAKTYVLTLFIVNWALTAVVAFITVSAGVGRPMVIVSLCSVFLIVRVGLGSSKRPAEYSKVDVGEDNNYEHSMSEAMKKARLAPDIA